MLQFQKISPSIMEETGTIKKVQAYMKRHQIEQQKWKVFLFKSNSIDGHEENVSDEKYTKIII